MANKKEKELFNISNEPSKTSDQFKYVIKDWTVQIDSLYRIVFETNIRTSSCGSLQIQNAHIYNSKHIRDWEFKIVEKITKSQKQEILNNIIECYENDKRNNIFFIDAQAGILEKLFSELQFKKVWDYTNYNTEHIVNMWCLNRWTKEEVEEIINEENNESDDDWNDEDDY